MGRPPAYIFIVRHGKRLDAADKQWHLSSPTPYDPPLTYGGWMQSRTVGARIASILREREEEEEAIAASPEPNTAHTKPKKRRYKVVIHSSPFLRCVQSSIAIAAGLASSPPSPTSIERSPSPRSLAQVSPLSSPPVRPPTATPSHAITPLDSSNHSSVSRTVLRLDAFLGEWLSPDYFEHITPPPRSSLLLATAKAELLRRENYNDYSHFHTQYIPNTSSQLWNAAPNRGSPSSPSHTPESGALSSLESLSSLRGSLPRQRSDSVGILDLRAPHKVPSPDSVWGSGYIGPVPSYALSTSEPIPRGYVAHARDACVDVDYQWDSSRDNIGWGDGGVLPEEWAEMHQRFRKGLKRLVDWYSTTENPGEMVTKTAPNPVSAKPAQIGDDGNRSSIDHDEDTIIENVVVLVSHGAGCNALIGAITQQPVLIDVGMSSITMAERKPEFDEYLNANNYEETASSIEEPLITKQPTLSEIYELRLFANTDHLHSAITPPSLSRSSSAAGRNPRGRYTNGFATALKEVNFGAPLYGGSASGGRSNSSNASLGSMRRGSPIPSSLRQPLASTAGTGGMAISSGASKFPTQPDGSGSNGLWAPPNTTNVAEKADSPPLPNFGRQGEPMQKYGEPHAKTQEHNSNPNNPTHIDSTRRSATKSESESSLGEERDKFDGDPVPRLWAGTSNGGLWGSPRPPGEAERIRDLTATKRRWTVNQQ